MNKRQWVLGGLVLTTFLQVSVLAGEYLNAVYPIWFGQEVKLKTIPVDPRSLFRGNYAMLNYEISNVPMSELQAQGGIRSGERVYVTLKPGEAGLYEADEVSLTEPGSGLFIRGRLRPHRWDAEQANVLYGIEAFFAPKEQALALEDELRDGGVAVVMIAANGKATLQDVVAN